MYKKREKNEERLKFLCQGKKPKNPPIPFSYLHYVRMEFAIVN